VEARNRGIALRTVSAVAGLVPGEPIDSKVDRSRYGVEDPQRVNLRNPLPFMNISFAVSQEIFGVLLGSAIFSP
jgi:hypothetical protein